MSSFQTYMKYVSKCYLETKSVVDTHGRFTQHVKETKDMSNISSLGIKYTPPSRLLRPYVYVTFTDGVRIREISSMKFLLVTTRGNYPTLYAPLKEYILQSITEYNETLFHMNDITLDYQMDHIHCVLLHELKLEGLPPLRRRHSVQPRARLTPENVKRWIVYQKCMHNRTLTNMDVQVKYQSKTRDVRLRELTLMFRIAFREMVLKELIRHSSSSATCV